jgi:hypothetical protein
MSTRIITSLLALTLLLLLTSCFNAIIGSGPVVTKEGSVGQFTGLDVSHAFNVRITQSDQCRVQIKTNENLIPYLLLENDGGILRIGFRHGMHITNTTSEAIIEMPSVREIHFSGATNGELIGDWSMSSLRVDMSGASRLKGSVNIEDLKADLSGASSVSLQGSGARIDLSASGASGFEMRDFAAGDATIDMSGASHAFITVNGNLNCELSGASSVRYRGDPKLGSLNTSGASSVHRD